MFSSSKQQVGKCREATSFMPQDPKKLQLLRRKYLQEGEFAYHAPVHPGKDLSGRNRCFCILNSFLKQLWLSWLTLNGRIRFEFGGIHGI